MIIHHNGIDREATETEIAEIELVKQEAKEAKAIELERAKEKTAILAKLGLTADELTALLS